MIDFPPTVDDPHLIGEGGQGSVYSVRWVGDPRIAPVNTRVAIKFLERADARLLKRLAHRRAHLVNIEHPNLVRILDIGLPPQASTAYVVMEHMEGGNLRARLEDFRTPRYAVALAQQVVTGLVELHSEDYVHRDIKPENILFASAVESVHEAVKSVRIADFDLMRLVGTTDTSTQMAGSANYMAPEIQAGAREFGKAADIYSVGVLMYEILACRLPKGSSEWRPSRYNRAVRGTLDQIVLGCLQQDPGRRYSAEQLLQALVQLSKGNFPSRPAIPRPSYPRFKVGDVELDVVLFFGGDGVHRYNHPDGVEVTSSTHDLQDVPNVLFDATEDWLRWREADADRRGAPFENRRQPRVLEAGARLTEGNEERLHPMRLRLGVTDYFTTQCTNFAIDLILPDRRTIFEAYAGEYNDFSHSVLANPLATNFSVVTDDGTTKTIFMSQRGKLVGGNVEFDNHNRVPAVSGTGHPLHDCDERGRFDVFKAGIREAREEVLGDYDLIPEELTFFGFARTGLMMFPFLFGEIRVPMSADEYKEQRILHRHDVFAKEGVPLTIDAVTEWIRKLYFRRNQDGQLISRPSHTGIFSIYQSLLYEFPNEARLINSLLRE
jgi:serine/threonine protein kinase